MRARGAVVMAVLALAGCATPVKGDPFVLYTHCGIDDVRYQGRYYEAVQPLSDGGDNPPEGWGNPEQPGTIRAVTPTEVEFRDDAGHVVVFRLRPQATSPKRTCL